jgi:membrane protein implicated in regulation of membrane protease activity
VRKFLAALPTLSGNQDLVNKVSFRLLLTAMSFVVLMILGALLASNVYNTAVGQSMIQFFIFVALNAGSTFTIWAFIESQSKSLSKSGNRTAELKTQSARNGQSSATHEIASAN